MIFKTSSFRINIDIVVRTKTKPKETKMISRQVNGYVDNLCKIKNILSCDWVFEKTLVNCRKCRNIFLYLSRLKIATTNNSSSIFSGNLMRLIAFVWVSTNSTLATKVLVLCLIKSYQFCDHSIWKWLYNSINCTVFLVIDLLNQKQTVFISCFSFLQLY